jgi:amidase
MNRLPRHRSTAYELVAAPPQLEVGPGETFVVETEDAFGGAIVTEGDLPTSETFGDRWARDEWNPCAGPIAVRGACPGDVLVVHIHDISVADQGVTCVFPDATPFANPLKYRECDGPFTTVVHHVQAGAGQARAELAVGRTSLSWQLDPHVGTIGVAPLRPVAAGADTSLGQGPWGGNLDVRDARAGSSVLLPVEVEGACLYVGDVHSSMADGEYTGAGVETSATMTLSCELRPRGHPLPFMRIETPDALIQVNSSRPLEAAIDEAFRWMLDWLVDDYGFAPREAYSLLGIHPDVRINVYQMVRLGRMSFTVGVSFPRSAVQDLRD